MHWTLTAHAQREKKMDNTTVIVLCHHCGGVYQAPMSEVDVENGCPKLDCIARRAKK